MDDPGVPRGDGAVPMDDRAWLPVEGPPPLAISLAFSWRCETNPRSLVERVPHQKAPRESQQMCPLSNTWEATQGAADGPGADSTFPIRQCLCLQCLSAQYRRLRERQWQGFARWRHCVRSFLPANAAPVVRLAPLHLAPFEEM